MPAEGVPTFVQQGEGVVMVLGGDRSVSPRVAAAQAAAAVSIGSFLRRPPRERVWIFAVAVGGRSTTVSPRLNSHCAR